jgi:hypothetical protein
MEGFWVQSFFAVWSDSDILFDKIEKLRQELGLKAEM